MRIRKTINLKTLMIGSLLLGLSASAAQAGITYSDDPIPTWKEVDWPPFVAHVPVLPATHDSALPLGPGEKGATFDLPVYDSLNASEGNLSDLPSGDVDISTITTIESLGSGSANAQGVGHPGGAVPAPGALLVLGLGALGARRRRRR